MVPQQAEDEEDDERRRQKDTVIIPSKDDDDDDGMKRNHLGKKFTRGAVGGVPVVERTT